MRETGQAFVEYVLILVLLVMSLAVILSITGPAVGNVFSNQVANLLNLTTTPEDPLTEGEFWDLVTAVASYTPDTVDLIPNTPIAEGDTDGDGILNAADNCPTVFDPTNTCDPGIIDTDNDGVVDASDNCPLVFNPGQEDNNGWRDAEPDGDACEPGAPAPTTDPNIPTATPRDRDFPYPFEDDGNEDNWETDFDSVLRGPWNAEWWDIGGGAGGCNNGAIFDPATGDYGANDPKATSRESDVIFPRSSHPYWNTLGSNPEPTVGNDFCSRFEQTFRLPPTTAPTTYVWHYRAANGMRLYINGALWIDEWNLADQTERTTDWVVNENGGEFTITIIHRDTGGDARLQVALDDGGVRDQGECDWQSVSSDNGVTARPEGTGNGQFWSDSPNRDYYNDTFCILRLRGVIDLGLAQSPYVEWWNIIDLNFTDSAYFAVREAGQEYWVMQEIYTGPTSNASWTREELRLANFDGIRSDTRAPETGLDFRGRTIEVAFILETDGADRGDGWYIDDFRVFEKVFNLYFLGYSDDVESGTNDWITEGEWGLTSDRVYSGNNAWTDSPAGNYSNNASNSLQLNGKLDLTSPSVSRPEIAFFQSWDLNNTDRIFVEVSTDEGVSWNQLRENTSAPNYIRQGSGANIDFQLITIPLDDDTISQNYIGERIFVRFRLESDGSNTADGWYVDDIQFRVRPLDFPIEPDFCDDLESGDTEWIREGRWQITTEQAYQSNRAFSDSPGGDYTNDSDNPLTLRRDLNLTGTTNPVLTFWHRWELGGTDKLNVDVSTDDGANWTNIWQQYHSDRPEGYATQFNGLNWNRQTAWQRVVVPLNDYQTQTNLRLRFRLDALVGNNVHDGWYVDDICVVSHTEPISVVPWSEDFDDGDDAWYVGGEWARDNDLFWEGSHSMATVPRVGGNRQTYSGRTDSVLELRGALDLTTLAPGSKPVLYYWERYEIDTNDYTYVEIQRVQANGLPIRDAGGNITEPWTPVAEHPESRNHAFNRRQIPLDAYIGSYIRLRFRLQALNGGGQDEGWHIDSLSIVDRNTLESPFALPFAEDASVGAPNWVREGDWDIINERRPLGSGSALGPGQWNVEYFNNPGGASPNFPTDPSDFWGSETIPEINFNWGSCGSCAPAIVLANNDDGNIGNNWLARYTRTLFFPQEVTYRVQLESDDGHRMFINTGLVPHDSTSGCSGSVPPWGNGGSCRSTYNSVTFQANTSYTVVLEMYEQFGGAKMIANFTQLSGPSQATDPFPGIPWQARYYSSCEDISVANLAGATAWNTIPEPVNALNFDWGTGAPDTVQTNNDTTQRIYEPTGDQVVMEAEQFSFSTVGQNGEAWGLETGFAGFSGTGAMMVPENSTGVARYDSADSAAANFRENGPMLGYNIRFANTGTYTVFVRMRQGPDGGGSNSAWIGFNGAWQGVNQGFSPTNNTYTWYTNQQGTSVATTITVTDTTNIQTLNLWPREDGTIVDKIYLYRNPSGIAHGDTQVGPAATANTSAACPHPTGDPTEYWQASFFRQVAVNDPTTLVINIDSNDGHALWVDGVRVTNMSQWTSNGPTSSTNSFTLPTGITSLRVDYRSFSHSDGGNSLELSYSLDGPVFHSDQLASGDYAEFSSSGMFLENVIDLTGETNATITWWDRYEVGNQDRLLIEVSTVGGDDAAPGAATNWVTVYERLGNDSDDTWRRRLVDLTSYVGQEIIIRFRLEALNNDDEDNGWFIDEIAIAD